MDSCQRCIHAMYIVPHIYGSSSFGWACLRTGGKAIEVCGHYSAKFAQAQDSVIEQLERIIPVANNLKLYDAADYLQTLVDNQKAKEQ